MTRHFLYLISRSARNNLLRQLRRLKNPRYAIAVLFGLGYFFLVFGGMQDPESRREVGGIAVTGGRMLGPLLIAIVAAWWWLWGGHRTGLLLSPAETHLLLPAPVSRRALIRYRILAAQPGILFSALMGSLFTGGTSLPFPLRLLGLWVMIATLHMHQVAASLVHAAAQEQGRRGIRRNIVPLVLFSGAFGTLLWSMLRAAADMRRASDPAAAFQRLVAVMSEPGPELVLMPFSLLVAPAVAATATEWLSAFAAAAGLLMLHYLWVQRSDAAFEEVAAEEGAKLATRAAAVKSGGITRLRFTSTDRPKKLAQPWLPLAPTGFAAYAVTWKNVLLAQRSVRVLALAIPIGIMVVGLLALMSDVPFNERTRVIGFVLLGFAAMVSVGGPMAVRLDLRVDLRYIDLLRTYPVRGQDLVAAGIAASTLVICSAQLLLALPGLVFITIGGVLETWQALLAALAILICAPAVNGLSVVIQNGIALLYPGWSRIGEGGGGGIETVGQNMLSIVGTLVLLGVALIPPAIGGGVVGGALWLMIREYAAVPALIAVVIVIAAEVGLATMWLGSLYDSTDPVEAGLLVR